MIEHVDDADHPQLLVLRVTEFNQARIDAALQQELHVLVNAVLVHAAAGVTLALVTQVQRVMFGHKMQVQHPHQQVAVAFEAAPL